MNTGVIIVNKSKYKAIFFNLDLAILAFAFTYWMLPIVFGYRYVWGVRLAILLPLVIFLITKYMRFHPVSLTVRGRVATACLVIFAGLWGIAVVRTAIREFGATLFILEEFLVYGVLILHLLLSWAHSNQDRPKVSRLRYAIILSFGIFILTNVALYALGMRQPDQIYLTSYCSQILLFLGLDVDRVVFPLASGINSFGILAGAVFILYVPYVSRHPASKERAIAFVMMIFCSLVIVMTDSRGAILFCIATLIVSKVPAKLFRYSRWIPLIASLAPIVVMLFMPSLFQNLVWMNRPPSDLSAAEKEVLQSQYCGDRGVPAAGALSNRPLIWSAVLDELQQPKPIHMIGYGFRGQVFSGISDELSCIFLSFVERRLASAHNIWLQTTLDLGYAGSLAVLGLTALVILRLSKLSIDTGDPTYKSMLYGILYLMFAGSLEAILTPDYMGTFLMYTLIVMMSVISNDEKISS